MRKKIRKYLKVVAVILGITALGYLGKYTSLKAQRQVQVNTLNEINEFCNSTITDIEKNETELLNLINEETDPLILGKYNSALVQINLLRGNYDNISKYSKEAIDNYKKVHFGEYYAISESKNVLWALIKIEKYSEAYILANEIVNMINEGGEKLLSIEELVET